MWAQGRALPFETIGVAVGGVSQVNRNGLSRGWAEPSGGEVALVTPFYVGSVEAGVQILPYRSRLEEVPSFESYSFFLGWRESARLPARLRLEGGFRIGLMQMRFDQEGISEAQQVEREFRADALAGLSMDVGRGWRVGGQASYGTLLLSEPQRLVHVHFGVQRAFRTPAALRRLLE